MRIGIYTSSYPSRIGGGYTLIETIKNEIISNSNYEHEFIIFFCDQSAPKYYNNCKIPYINCYIKKPFILYRIIRKLFRIFLRINIKIKTINDIFINNNIDFLWFLGPFNIETTIPFVFTVWDLGHRTIPSFPEVSGDNWQSRENTYQYMLPRATYIITGNETGKKEILTNYSVNPEKIHVIPFPVPSFCFSNTQVNVPAIQLKEPYVFYPAQFWSHKNHIIIIEAIAWLRDVKNITVFCYFSGYDYGNLKHVTNLIKKYKLENQIFILGFIDRDPLIYLYKNALALVYTSFLGPNNLPPLEATALGCPVIYSNIPGHIEQMEGTGISVDAKNYIDVGEAILRIYSNQNFRNDMIKSGLEFINKYKSYSYFNKMKEIINLFYYNFRTWKD
jgi:glycosyltransferase involved in cell wall biosynthesis